MKFNLRGAIVTSLSLQIILILLAPIRKRLSNRWIIVLTWLAYLVADWVADYAFGLISKAQFAGGTSESEADANGDLLAFWAPFLLLHLGGPDTITAFALEDNELWGRHLLNLLLQLVIAGYVFYQSLPSNKLIVPTILMFIGGTIKYIERTSALYLASSSRLQGSLLASTYTGQNYHKLMEVYVSMKKANIPASFEIPELDIESIDGEKHVENLNDREVIKAAFFYFTTFKGLLVDGIISFRERNQSMKFFSSRNAKDAFRVIETELNLFYDALYTKAAVVHCPRGYLFRAISIGSIITAFALFHVLNKHGFHEYDIRITYILLLGAVALEFVALSMLIRSNWTIALLGRSKKRHICSSIGSTFIEFLLIFKYVGSLFTLHILHARWSKSIFQDNLIESRLRKWRKETEKLLGLIPLPELFGNLKSGRVVKYSDTLGEFIFNELKRKSQYAFDPKSMIEMCAARGEWAIKHTKTKRNCKDLLPFIRVDYGESLLLWHIATEVCYNMDKSTNNHPREMCKVLSDYMLYLMIKQPGMMSVVAGICQIRIKDTCAEMDVFFTDIADQSEQNKTKEKACECLLNAHQHVDPNDVEGVASKSVLFDACLLAKELYSLVEDKWDIMSEVWVELLGYAAVHCRPFNHAQQLSKGGELVTLVWLLMAQLGLSEQFQLEGGKLIIQK
ncbi:hypothetical protein ACJRO7_010351 [Eucalyptus globulus]|uniref:DUF4220 domain-containing protein n=1 Tax=Eucalyptus globulus TaxID=34317 RepID=A0ABD3LBT1_EUCGL